jgi:4-hydroxy-2-oxoheptanedioate aldolase
VEAIAGAGFDWILLDTEHSPTDLENLLTQLQAAAPYSNHPVVRVPWNDMVTVKRVLDIGAQSLLVPYVQNVEEARHAVAHTRYPPAACAACRNDARDALRPRQGLRQARARGDLRAAAGGDRVGAEEHRSDLRNRRRRRRVHRPGGPACLARLRGRNRNPKVKPLIDDAIRRIRKAGKAPGILTPNEADARHWLECGALFVAVGSDAGILARGADALAAKFKS